MSDLDRTIPATAPTTLVEAFTTQGIDRPDAPAMYARDGDSYAALTWSQALSASQQFAAYLVSLGVREQDHVAIWSNNRPEWHVADMAILALRCRPVPVYQTLSAEQVAYALQHSESRVIVVESDKQVDAVLAHRAELPRLEKIVVLNSTMAADATSPVVGWQAALALGTAELPSRTEEMQRRSAAVQPDDIATLIYTSGTTGPPKAVLLTHANIMATTAALSTVMESSADDRVISYLPLAHIAERQVSEFRSYIYGNPVWFLDGIPNLGARLREVRPTVFFAVPRVWEKMAQTIRNSVAELPLPRRLVARWALRTGDRFAQRQQHGSKVGFWLDRRHRLADKLVLATLRREVGLDKAKMVASGAAPIGADVLRYFSSFGIEVCEVYGQTEDTGITTINRPGASRIGSVGMTLPGIDVKLADDGEILVRGANVFSGYYKDAEATAETIVDGWLHTGDVGEVDAAGYWRITDRKKDLIITAGGKNISPSNIETLLAGSDLIGHAVAIGDRRPFMSALLTLDPEGAQQWARQNGVGGGIGEVAKSALLRTAVEAHVKAVNTHLSQVEQIKRWTVLGDDFGVGDELTPTLKVKRKVVAEKYATEIESMYSSGPSL